MKAAVIGQMGFERQLVSARENQSEFELTCNDLATDFRTWGNGSSQVIGLKRRKWSRGRDLNPRPADYESAALPLSYLGVVLYDSIRREVSAIRART